MKTVYFLLIQLVICIACNNRQKENKLADRDSTTFIFPSDSVTAKTDSRYFWTSDLDPKKGLVMIKTRPIPDDSLTALSMVQILNDTYPEIPIRIIKTSNDTIFIKISKSDYLTQQMGTSGAEAYLAEVTYNLTELKGINFVGFNFKPGDHAMP
jgi:hypothetical protein